MLGQIQLRKEIAARLKAARIAAGYKSIEDFCLKNNINSKAYPRHESGAGSMRASQAMQYCSLLNISLHWLMLGEDFGERNKTADASQIQDAYTRR